MKFIKTSTNLIVKSNYEWIVSVVGLLGGVSMFVSFFLPNISISTVLYTLGLVSALYMALYVLTSIEDQKKQVIENAIGGKVIEFRELDEGWSSVKKFRVLASDGKEHVVIIRGKKVISTREVGC